MRMMNESIHNGHGDLITVKELAPVGKVLVGGKDDGAVLIETVDQLKEVIDALLVHG